MKDGDYNNTNNGDDDDGGGTIIQYKSLLTTPHWGFSGTITITNYN